MSKTIKSIKWTHLNIPTHEEKLILSTMKEMQNDYNFFDSKHITKLENKLKKICPKRPWLTPFHAFSMRRSHLRDNLITRHRHVLAKKEHIKELYDKNIDITDIARRYNYSPVATFRILLQARGITSKVKLSNITKFPDKHLGKYDQQQLQLAIDNDIISMPDHSPIIEAAEGFEVDLEAYLKSKFPNAPYKTQPDMVKEQTETMGRAIATPDIYFPKGIKINGRKIFWIDAKNFYGANISNIRGGLKKQVKRYNQLYGPGAVIFKYSYSIGLKHQFIMNHTNPDQRALLLSWDGKV